MTASRNTTPDILDSHLKGVSLRLLWTILISTIVICSTLLGVYYNFKSTIQENNLRMQYDIQGIKERLDRNGIK